MQCFHDFKNLSQPQSSMRHETLIALTFEGFLGLLPDLQIGS